MKKIVFAVMAVVALGMTSCGNKTQQAAPVDSVAIVDSLAEDAATGIIDQLKAQLEAGDASKLQEVLTAAKDKVAELVKQNPEVAREYVAKVQNYLKDNADKVKAVVGDNAAVQAAVSAIADVEPEAVVNGLLQSVGDAATDAKDAAKDAAAGAVEAGKAAVEEKTSEVKAAAQQKVDDAKAAVQQKADETKAAAKQKANEAVDNAAAAAKQKLGL